MPFGLLAALVAAASISLGCGSAAVRRFPLREPMWRDTDLEPVAVPCRPDPKPKPNAPPHQVCTPETYESSFAWDGADNIVFRPISHFFAVDPGHDAVNVNSFDEVADSSWFVNRIGRGGISIDDLERGFCGNTALDPSTPDGSWVIDQGKANGANPGFRIRDASGVRYLLKSDPAFPAEKATGATAIATRIYYAAGWWAPCDSVVYFRRSLLSLKPGLTVTDNTNTTRPFDEAALDKILKDASRRGDLIRMVASRWLPGRTIGPFKYEGVRDDDPHDVIPHQDRRDLRGARVIAEWLGHFDSREQNSMNTWMAADPRDPDASPGYIRHWYIDLGDCFGSEWEWDALTRRINHAYYLDIPYLAEDFVTLGTIERPWDRAERSKVAPIFSYFSAADFDPDLWRGGYPNPTFARMTEADAAWAARIIARFTPAHVEAAVRVGDFTNPLHTSFLVDQLLIRRQVILQRYFAYLSPITDLAVVPTSRLCATDLARQTATFPAERFRYTATSFAGSQLAQKSLGVDVAEAGRVCVPLAHFASDRGEPDDSAARYFMVDIHNGQSKGPVRAHLYDLGPQRGFRLVGVERPEDAQPPGSFEK